jgi:hypothetical protein
MRRAGSLARVRIPCPWDREWQHDRQWQWQSHRHVSTKGNWRRVDFFIRQKGPSKQCVRERATAGDAQGWGAQGNLCTQTSAGHRNQMGMARVNG